MAIADDGLSPEIMLAFYRRLYPFKSIYQWLNHDHIPTKLFTHREFAFTLQGDVYLRYNSFNNAEELKKQVCNLNPTRFEIGPVYSARVCCLMYSGCFYQIYDDGLLAKRQKDYTPERIQTVTA
jgi:DNA primase small subunit